jgi:hypothetical protein
LTGGVALSASFLGGVVGTAFFRTRPVFMIPPI